MFIDLRGRERGRERERMVGEREREGEQKRRREGERERERYWERERERERNWRQREGGRERERHQCERKKSIGCLSYRPQLGVESATWVYALTNNQTWNFLVYGVTLPTKLTTQPESFNKYFSYLHLIS